MSALQTGNPGDANGRRLTLQAALPHNAPNPGSNRSRRNLP